jgi:hypothetical protein
LHTTEIATIENIQLVATVLPFFKKSKKKRNFFKIKHLFPVKRTITAWLQGENQA